jgi:hypothetical protein
VNRSELALDDEQMTEASQSKEVHLGKRVVHWESEATMLANNHTVA